MSFQGPVTEPAGVYAHNYANRMGYGIGSSPGALRVAGQFIDATAETQGLTARAGTWVVRARPDFGTAALSAESTHRRAYAGEVRVGQSNSSLGMTSVPIHVQRINRAMNPILMETALVEFAQDAYRVLGRMAQQIGVDNLGSNTFDPAGPRRAMRLVLNCVVKSKSRGASQTRFPISCNWAGSPEDVGRAMASYFTFTPSRRRGGTVNRSIIIPKGNQFIPRNAQDVISTAHAHNPSLDFADGSDFQFFSVTWAGLIVLKLDRLLMGNGVLVNSLLRSHMCFTGTLNGLSVLGIDIATQTDCLFLSLAIAHHFAQLERRVQTDNLTKSQQTSDLYKTLLDWVQVDSESSRQVWLTRMTHLKTTIYQEGSKHVNGFDLRSLRAGTRDDLYVFVKYCFPEFQVNVVNENFELLETFHAPQPRNDLTVMHLMLRNSHYLPLIRYAIFEPPRLRTTRQPKQDQRVPLYNGVDHRERARRVHHTMQQQARESQRINKMRLGTSPESLQDALEKFNARSPKFLYPSKVHNQINRRVAYFDIETEQRESMADTLRDLDLDAGGDVFNHNYSQIPVMLGWVFVDATDYQLRLEKCEPEDVGEELKKFVDLQPSDVHVYTGYDCICNFWDALYEMDSELLNGLTLYAHNGGRYDFILILRFLLSSPYLHQFQLVSILPKGSGFLTMEVMRIHDRARFTFGDTFFHLSTSLAKLCRDHGPPHQKLEGTVDYDSFRLFQFQKGEAGQVLEKEWTDYLVADILSLAEIYERYRLVLFHKYKIDLTRRIYTAATLSKRIFTSSYYDKDQFPLFTLSSACETFVRESYHGGRCEVFTHRYTEGPVYYYDFTSLYPYEMCKELPYGKERPCTTTLYAIEAGHFFGFVQVQLRSSDLRNPSTLHPPFLAVVAKDSVNSDRSEKLCFPQFENFTTLYCFSEEIKFIMENKLPYEFKTSIDLPAYRFDKGPVLRAFSEDMFERKRVADSKTERQIAKVTVNSGYGFWGMRRLRPSMQVERVEESNCVQLSDQIIQGLFSHIGVHGGVFMGTTVSLADSATIIPTLASAVTAYARMTLYKLMMDILKHGGKLLYCDTDSVITNIRFEDHPAFKDQMGVHLGGLTNELEDWPNQCAEEFIGLAPKMYALRCKEDAEGETKNSFHKAGHKGFRNVEFDQMVQLWEENKPIEETQMQFRFDKNSLFIDPENEKVEYVRETEELLEETLENLPENHQFEGNQTAFASLTRSHVRKRMDRDTLNLVTPKRRRVSPDSVDTRPLIVGEAENHKEHRAHPCRLSHLTYEIKTNEIV